MCKTKIKLFNVTFFELWIHIKGNNLNYLDCRYLQNCDESWYYIEFCSTIFPFNSLSSNKNILVCCTKTDSNITQWEDLENDHDSLLLLKPSSNLELGSTGLTMLLQKMIMTQKKLLHLNIITLMKCITLKYLIKINHFPYSI